MCIQMRRSLSVVIFCLGLLVCAQGLAQAASRKGASRAIQGPWPTKPMIEAAVHRVVVEWAKHFKLDQDQAKVLEEQMAGRWPEFFKRNRPALQKVVNECLETVIIGEPPTPARVAKWAKALQPVIAEADKELGDTYKNVRKVLGPEQIKTWDTGYKNYRLGKTFALTELGKLARGQFNPKHWQNPLPKPKPDPLLKPPPSVVRQQSQVAAEVGKRGRSGRKGNRFRKNRRQTQTAGPARFGQSSSATGSTIVGGRTPRKLSAWESYVKQFIKKHDLDSDRANSAMAILKDIREQARSYEATHSKELKRLGQAVSAADSVVRPRLQAQLNELRAPVDDLFGELRARLENLLTESERGEE